MINKILLFISIILFIVIICIILYLLLNQKTHHKKSVYNVTHSEKKYFTDIKCKISTKFIIVVDFYYKFFELHHQYFQKLSYLKSIFFQNRD